MEQIFEICLERTGLVPQIKWADLNNGQMDNYDERPPVKFPAILFTIDIAQAEDIGQNLQRCNARITVSVCFDYTGRTSCSTPAPVREQSLEYLRTVRDVYKTFQGFYREGVISRFTRKSQVTEKRKDGYKVVNMIFEAGYIDKDAG